MMLKRFSKIISSESSFIFLDFPPHVFCDIYGKDKIKLQLIYVYKHIIILYIYIKQMNDVQKSTALQISETFLQHSLNKIINAFDKIVFDCSVYVSQMCCARKRIVQKCFLKITK